MRHCSLVTISQGLEKKEPRNADSWAYYHDASFGSTRLFSSLIFVVVQVIFIVVIVVVIIVIIEFVIVVEIFVVEIFI